MRSIRRGLASFALRRRSGAKHPLRPALGFETLVAGSARRLVSMLALSSRTSYPGETASGSEPETMTSSRSCDVPDRFSAAPCPPTRPTSEARSASNRRPWGRVGRHALEPRAIVLRPQTCWSRGHTKARKRGRQWGHHTVFQQSHALTCQCMSTWRYVDHCRRIGRFRIRWLPRGSCNGWCFALSSRPRMGACPIKSHSWSERGYAMSSVLSQNECNVKQLESSLAFVVILAGRFSAKSNISRFRRCARLCCGGCSWERRLAQLWSQSMDALFSHRKCGLPASFFLAPDSHLLDCQFCHFQDCVEEAPVVRQGLSSC